MKTIGIQAKHTLHALHYLDAMWKVESYLFCHACINSLLDKKENHIRHTVRGTFKSQTGEATQGSLAT